MISRLRACRPTSRAGPTAPGNTYPDCVVTEHLTTSDSVQAHTDSGLRGGPGGIDLLVAAVAG